MQIESVYQDMWRRAWPLITQNAISIDPFLTGKQDTRSGITLLARVNGPVAREINTFLRDLQKIEPDQYYYPASDLHLTVMSILSCVEGYRLLGNDKARYIEFIHTVVQNSAQFSIEYKGITVSDSGIVLCGYVNDQSLTDLRNCIRSRMPDSGLSHSMDKRYTLITAHSTIVRFKTRLQHPDGLADFLQANRNRYFGYLNVSQLELVVNDWYQRQDKTEKLAEFTLV